MNRQEWFNHICLDLSRAFIVCENQLLLKDKNSITSTEQLRKILLWTFLWSVGNKWDRMMVSILSLGRFWI